MKAICKVVLSVRRVGEDLETLLFVAAAFLVVGGTVLMCLPSVPGLA